MLLLRLGSHDHHLDYSAAIMPYLCVSVPVAIGSYQKVDMEVFNVHNDLIACCAREGKTGTDKLIEQTLTQKNLKLVLHPALTGSRTRSRPMTACPGPASLD